MASKKHRVHVYHSTFQASHRCSDLSQVVDCCRHGFACPPRPMGSGHGKFSNAANRTGWNFILGVGLCVRQMDDGGFEVGLFCAIGMIGNFVRCVRRFFFYVVRVGFLCYLRFFFWFLCVFFNEISYFFITQVDKYMDNIKFWKFYIKYLYKNDKLNMTIVVKFWVSKHV